MKTSMVVDFQDYEISLETVMAFKYLGRVIIALDDEWPEVVANLQKDRSRCACLSRILWWGGGRPPDLW